MKGVPFIPNRRSPLDGMAAVARERVKRPDAAEPTLDRIINVARDLMVDAVTTGTYGVGEAAFPHGDERTVWIDGWPCGEWASHDEIFGGGDGRIAALRIFDPALRESIHWFLQPADRRRYEQKTAVQRRSRNEIEKEKVEEPLAAALRAQGHDVRQQVQCSVGRVDIHDATIGEIIECEASGGCSDLVAAVMQLRRYSLVFGGAKLTVAVPTVDDDAEWLAAMLRREGICIIEVDVEVG
jgi:hypothetical protein